MLGRPGTQANRLPSRAHQLPERYSNRVPSIHPSSSDGWMALTQGRFAGGSSTKQKSPDLLLPSHLLQLVQGINPNYSFSHPKLIVLAFGEMSQKKKNMVDEDFSSGTIIRSEF